jgi:genome maintenance exonuclease 1
MITNTHPYSNIKRKLVDGKRLYDTESGPLPSVTTILDRTKSAESRAALQNWRNRVGNDAAQKITTEAANVGTLMHQYMEDWLIADKYERADNMIHRTAGKMADTIIQNIEPDLGTVWGTEVNLYYPGLYAGTTDLAGIWKGQEAIMDFKQSNRPKKREWVEDYELQIVAYGLAHNELFGTNICTGQIFMCSRACEFQLFEIDKDRFAEMAIKWAKRVDQFYNL